MCILALDFGGTKLAAAVALAGSTNWLAFRQTYVPHDANAQDSLRMIMSLAAEIIAPAHGSFEAAGVSFGGPIDPRGGIVRLSHHIPGWEGFPLQSWLEEQFGVPTVIANDANAAAYGEFRLGAGRGCSSMMYITISTGVGGGVILDGKLWDGQDGMAGEIGHMIIDPGGPVCTCGKRGCVESFASGGAIAKLAEKNLRVETGRGSILRRMADEAGEITAKIVSEACSEGDELACEMLEAAARRLGTSIGNVANLLNLERFILGGGVTKAGKRWWEAVHWAARQAVLPGNHLTILPAELGEDAPLWGAKILAEQYVNIKK